MARHDMALNAARHDKETDAHVRAAGPSVCPPAALSWTGLGEMYLDSYSCRHRVVGDRCRCWFLMADGTRESGRLRSYIHVSVGSHPVCPPESWLTGSSPAKNGAFFLSAFQGVGDFHLALLDTVRLQMSRVAFGTPFVDRADGARSRAASLFA